MEEIIELIEKASAKYNSFYSLDIYFNLTCTLLDLSGDVIKSFESLEDLRNHLNG